MLLKTRFYLPPLRAGVIRRDHLLQRLQASGGGSLVLVSAPAGYGKTTLISQWLHQYPHTFAWLTLGAEHNVIAVFWQYLLVALRQMVPELGRDAEQQLLTLDTPDYQQVVIALLNDLDQFSINNRAGEPITLVLDDFHVLHNARLLQLFNLLLDHLPACIRIVITARGEPDLKLAKRRASGQLMAFGIHELRFTAEESRAFFAAVLTSPQTPEQVDALCARTEGWIAGLQLVALSLRQQGVEVSTLLTREGLDRNVADYLLDEVFAHLPAHLQQFLQQSALVKRFCAGLTNAIDERHDSLSILLELESLNLFLMPLDNHRTWYRYHELFRQFLLQRFVRGDALLRDGALARALIWLEQNGYWDDAMALCVEWQRWPDALRLLQQQDLALPANADREKWLQWLRQIPAPMLATVPALQRKLDVACDGQESVTDTIASDLIEPLTQQEKVVLELIGQGLSNKAIARQLQISLNTLKVHIRNLYGKMGVENRREILVKTSQK